MKAALQSLAGCSGRSPMRASAQPALGAHPELPHSAQPVELTQVLHTLGSELLDTATEAGVR